VLMPDDMSLDQLLHRTFPGDEPKPTTPPADINTPPTEDTNNNDDNDN